MHGRDDWAVQRNVSHGCVCDDNPDRIITNGHRGQKLNRDKAEYLKAGLAKLGFRPVYSGQKAFTVEKPASLNYREGDRVKHIKFGEGTVKSIKDGGKDYEVTVEFDTAGQKKMFASFAKLKKA